MLMDPVYRGRIEFMFTKTYAQFKIIVMLLTPSAFHPP